MSVREKRPSSKWRKSAFAKLVERDGALCGECGTEDRVIWRGMGITCGELWGTSPWETAKFTMVYPTSVLEVDHRTPLSQGGSNDLDNLWLLCRDCHKRKTSAERSARLKALFAEARQ